MRRPTIPARLATRISLGDRWVTGSSTGGPEGVQGGSVPCYGERSTAGAKAPARLDPSPRPGRGLDAWSAQRFERASSTPPRLVATPRPSLGDRSPSARTSPTRCRPGDRPHHPPSHPRGPTLWARPRAHPRGPGLRASALLLGQPARSRARLSRAPARLLGRARAPVSPRAGSRQGAWPAEPRPPSPERAACAARAASPTGRGRASNPWARTSW